MYDMYKKDFENHLEEHYNEKTFFILECSLLWFK